MCPISTRAWWALPALRRHSRKWPRPIGSITPEAKGSENQPDYLMDHSTILYLIGPDGKFVKHFTYGTDAKGLADGAK